MFSKGQSRDLDTKSKDINAARKQTKDDKDLSAASQPTVRSGSYSKKPSFVETSNNIIDNSRQEPQRTVERKAVRKDDHLSGRPPASTSSTSTKTVMTKSQQSYDKSKQQTAFYMGLIKQRESRFGDEDLDDQSQNQLEEEDQNDQLKVEKGKTSQSESIISSLTSKTSTLAKKSTGIPLAAPPKQSSSSNVSAQKKLVNDSESNELRLRISELTREVYEVGVRNKEQSMEMKRLRGKITSLESEKSELSAQLREKDSIISQTLGRLEQSETGDFSAKRNFLIQGQMVKQRRYIQHLTKLTKSNKTISTELQHQLGTIDEVLDKLSDGGKSVENVKANVKNLRRKFNDLSATTSYEFAQNLLKEFDSNSNKEVSDQIGLIQLESSANKLFNTISSTICNASHLTEEHGEVLQNAKQFVECCLRYGLDIRLSENQYEVIQSNEEIRNEVLRNVRAKMGGFKSPMVEDILYNGQLFEFLHRVQLDRNQLVHRYATPTAVDSLVRTLMIKVEVKGTSQSSSSSQSSALLQKVKNCIGVDMQILNQMNNVLRVLLFQSQISLHYLNDFVVQQINHLNTILEECVYSPFADMFEIYEKYFIDERNPHYPQHLAKVFNIHCEQIKTNLESVLNLQKHKHIQTSTHSNIPLVIEIQKVFKQLLNATTGIHTNTQR